MVFAHVVAVGSLVSRARIAIFQRARYRGLAKNLDRLEVSIALANLSMMRRRLLNA